MGFLVISEGVFQLSGEVVYAKAPPPDRCSVFFLGLLEQLEDLLKGSTRFASTLPWKITSTTRSLFR